MAQDVTILGGALVVEGIANKARAQNANEGWYCDLLALIMQYLSLRFIGDEEHAEEELLHARQHSLRDSTRAFFRNEIEAVIEPFAKDDEEQRQLYLDVAAKLFVAITHN